MELCGQQKYCDARNYLSWEMYGMHNTYVTNYVPQRMAMLVVKLELKTVYFYL